jgi:sterol desaturase/sphingolipid hydroxylase (fatty acid hydroxylase superfamily)
MNDPDFILKLAMSVAIAAVITAGIVVAVAEVRWMSVAGRLTRSNVKKMLHSLSPMPPNIVVSALMMPVWAGTYAAASTITPYELPINGMTILLAFLAADLSYYWEHRCAHRVKPLWALYHAIHHSSDAYTVATAYRVSFLNQFLAPAFYVPWILLGFEPLLIIGFQLLAFHYQAWLHTELIGRLPHLDAWLNTPANHRMHHSRAEHHLDVNFGAILMVWDRLFGTYARPEEDLEYGIPGAPPPQTCLGLYTEPWRAWLLRRPVPLATGSRASSASVPAPTQVSAPAGRPAPRV